MMKRFFSLILMLLFLIAFPHAALAEYTLTPAPVSADSVIQKLADMGHLGQPPDPAQYARALPDALRAFQQSQGLEITGELDTRTLVRLFTQTDTLPQTVWIPIYGGIRYHSNDRCSGMADPEPASAAAALILGFTPCKRCKP